MASSRRKRGLRPVGRLPLVRRRPAGPPVRRAGLRGLLGWIDQTVLWQMRTRGHGAPLEPAMRALGAAGEWAAVWVAIAAAGALRRPASRSPWASAAAVGPAAVGINYAVKVAVGRDRPILEEHPPLARAPSKLSFPSAHATSSMAAATAIGRIAPGSRGLVYGLATAICLTRPYLGMHYPSDVLAGAALGVAIGAAWPGLRRPGAEDRLIDLLVGAARPEGERGAPAFDPDGGRTTGIPAAQESREDPLSR